MSKIFVPIILNESAELFELSVTERNDSRTKSAKLLLKNEVSATYTDAIISKFDKLSHNVNFISFSDSSFDVFTPATYSARLGIYLALEQSINNRLFLDEWDAIVVTGNLNKNTENLEDITHVKEKYCALINYAKSIPGKYLFVYVSDKEEVLEEYQDIEIKRFSSTQTLRMLQAELFEPIFNVEQQRALDEIFEIDQTHPYYPPKEFDEVKKEAVKKDWKGCCICGDSNSGKSVFAFNICKYLMAIGRIDKPIWVTLKNSTLLASKYNNKNPFQELTNYITEKNCVLVIDTKNVIYNLFLNQKINEFLKSVGVKVPVILTAIKDTDNLDDKYLKPYFISNISGTYCKKIFSYAIKERNIDIEKTSDFQFLEELIVNKCSENVGNIYALARILKSETVRSLSRRLEMNNVLEIESEYINEVVNNLPSAEKFILWHLLWTYQGNEICQLRKKIYLEKNIQNPIEKNENWIIYKERFDLLNKFYDLGLLRLKIDNDCYITFDKDIYLYLLKDMQMFDEWKWFSIEKEWEEFKQNPKIFKDELLLSGIYAYCDSFIIHGRYHDFFKFLKKAIEMGCDYKHLALFARLVIIYEWPEKYILEYFDYLEANKFDIVRVFQEENYGETLYEFFEKYCEQESLLKYAKEKGCLSEEYLNILKNKKQYLKKFRDNKKNNFFAKLFANINLNRLFDKGKNIAFEFDDKENFDLLESLEQEVKKEL